MSESSEPDPFDRDPLCCLVGPTASGKTELALAIAERAGAEIISLDSMLVYRRLDIGTAKPSLEQRARVRHHLIDVVEPEQRYDVASWLRDARGVLAELQASGRRVLFVGGTGFYLAALLRGLFEAPRADLELRARLFERRQELGALAFHNELAALDPVSAARLHPEDAKRVVRAFEVLHQTGVPWSQLQREWSAKTHLRQERARLVGLAPPPGEQEARIRQRTHAMLAAGWREEAVQARAAGLGPTALQALGYAEVLAWHDGKLTFSAALERIVLRTRQFARRQQTWYRKFPIAWFATPTSPMESARLSERLLEHYQWLEPPMQVAQG